MYESITTKEQWARWLQSALLEALAGSGLRPEVRYREAEYEMTGAEQVLKKPEAYILKITLPLEWTVINELNGNDINVQKLMEIAEAVHRFAMDVWPDRISSDYQYEQFRKLPGRFVFHTDETPSILYRITMMKVCDQIGKRNIKKADLYEDMIIIYTRRGSWRIDFSDYRNRLDEVLQYMSAFMRRPIRHKYLYELRHKKDDKTKG